MPKKEEQTTEFCEIPNNSGKKPPCAAKCSKCGKEGWVGNDQHEEGDVKHRLFSLLTGKIVCDNCICSIGEKDI